VCRLKALSGSIPPPKFPSQTRRLRVIQGLERAERKRRWWHNLSLVAGVYSVVVLQLCLGWLQGGTRSGRKIETTKRGRGENNSFKATLYERILHLHCSKFLARTQIMTSHDAWSLRCKSGRRRPIVGNRTLECRGLCPVVAAILQDKVKGKVEQGKRK
jgi:hypothetical protein